jgi:hypothetical protein
MTYDEEHPETGSSNISKASPEWTEVLGAARAAHTGDGYVLHEAYAAINERVAAGEAWAKCANCGSPYQLTEQWGDMTVCSSNCFTEYCSYLNEAWR